MRIAPGIHRIGDHSIINAYLIEEANEVTLVDAGGARVGCAHAGAVCPSEAWCGE